ncbi:MAG: CHASE2 domain-containing protein [Nitrosomonas sp.]
MTGWHTYFPHATFILRTILLVAGVGLLSFFSVLERIDAVFYDKISTIQQSLPDNNIVIVAIDEESLQTLGRWPWSRSLHAELINRLQKTGSNVIGLDILFSEPQNDPFADELLVAGCCHCRTRRCYLTGCARRGW